MCDSGCDTTDSSDGGPPPPPPTSPALSSSGAEDMMGEEPAVDGGGSNQVKFPVHHFASHLDPSLRLQVAPLGGASTFLAAQAFSRDCMVGGADQLHPYEQHEIRRKTKGRSSRGHNAPPERAPAKRMRLAASLGNDTLLSRLLPACDPNAADELGRTALHFAACKGHNCAVRLLLAAGADPNQRDSIGNTPLHLAAVTNHFDVVTSLLRAGTDVSAADNHGRNPLQLAQSKLRLLAAAAAVGTSAKCEIRQIVEMMLEYLHKRGAEPEAELVTALASRLTLAEGQTAEVAAALASLSLEAKAEPEGGQQQRRRFGSESEATMMSLWKVGGIGKRTRRKF